MGLVFGPDEVTSGASSDIQQATRLARNMVTSWGFSDEVGVVFVGKDDASPEQKALVDREVQRLLAASYERTTKLIKAHRKDLEKIAKALIEYESLTGADITDVLKGRALVNNKSAVPSQTAL